MGQFVDVMLDTKGLQDELRALGDRADLAIASALNRAGQSGRAAMVKAIGRDTGIAAKAIRNEIDLDKANRTKPYIKVEIKGRRIPLIAFQAKGPEPSRGKGRGVSYRGPQGRGRIANAFISTMPSGHRGVFKRKGRKRLPVRELFGPSLPHVFLKYIDTFRSAASDAFVKTLAHEIDRRRAA